MWSRVDYSILPASSTKHLSIENRNFALALRKSTTDQTKSPQRSKNVLLADDDSFLEARLTRKNQQKPCNVSSCIIIEHDIAVAYKENQELTLQVNRLAEDLQDDQQFLKALTKEFESANANEQKLLQKLSSTENQKEETCRNLHKIRKERHYLEDEISRVQRRLHSLLHNGSFNGKEHRSPSKSRKHNGTFNTLQTGIPQWSCCMAMKNDAPGCIDDHSVGILSELVKISNIRVAHRCYSLGNNSPCHAFGTTMKSIKKMYGEPVAGYVMEDVGKMRYVNNGKRSTVNRPMSSPAGYRSLKK